MIPAEDFIAPRPKRTKRVLVVGAHPGTPSVKAELRAMGADEAVTVDGLPHVVARQRLRATPVDVVLIVGRMWTEPPAGSRERAVQTYQYRSAARYLAGGFPLRWLRGETVSDLRAMPGPGVA